jgi:cytochrome oxidase Cu insertion factor (SCO1/SenC/PrrC family)
MRRLVAGGLLVGAFLAACTGTPPPPPSPSAAPGPIAVGEVAPGFSLPSASGGQESLSDYRGKPVLLYFSMGPG